jgi:hypothetical protein
MIILPTVNVPHPLRQMITLALNDPRATPDTALILADAVEEYRKTLPDTSYFQDSLCECIVALRGYAPSLDKPRAAP